MYSSVSQSPPPLVDRNFGNNETAFSCVRSDLGVLRSGTLLLLAPLSSALRLLLASVFAASIRRATSRQCARRCGAAAHALYVVLRHTHYHMWCVD